MSDTKYVIYEKIRGGLDFCAEADSLESVGVYITALRVDEPELEIHETDLKTGRTVIKSPEEYECAAAVQLQRERNLDEVRRTKTLLEKHLKPETVKLIRKIDREFHSSIANFLSGQHRLALVKRWMTRSRKNGSPEDADFFDLVCEEPARVLRVTDGTVELFSDKSTLFYDDDNTAGDFHPADARADYVWGHVYDHLDRIKISLDKFWNRQWLEPENENEIFLFKLAEFGVGWQKNERLIRLNAERIGGSAFPNDVLREKFF